MDSNSPDQRKSETLWESQAAFAGDDLSVDMLHKVVSWIHVDVDPVALLEDRRLLEADIADSRIPVFAYSLHKSELRWAVCFRVFQSGDGRLLGWRSEPRDTRLLVSAFEKAIALATNRYKFMQLTAFATPNSIVADALRIAGFDSCSTVWNMRLQLGASSIGQAYAQDVELVSEWNPRLADLVLGTETDPTNLGSSSLRSLGRLVSAGEINSHVLSSHLGASEEYPGEFQALILRDDGTDAGVLILKTTPELAEIVYLGVKDDFRNQGHATSLLASAIAVCKSRGIKEAVAGVEATNLAAQKCYYKCGFKLLQELELWHYPLQRDVQAKVPQN